jgi:hypothetical protein
LRALCLGQPSTVCNRDVTAPVTSCATHCCIDHASCTSLGAGVALSTEVALMIRLLVTF